LSLYFFYQIIDLSANITPSSFLQWKPVCYKSENRAMKSGTKVKDYPLVDGDNILASIQGDRGLLYAYMAESSYDSHTYDVTGMNVSFGLSQDKFYSHTLYTAWWVTMILWRASIVFPKPFLDIIIRKISLHKKWLWSLLISFDWICFKVCI
jgi:hypothetical protein